MPKLVEISGIDESGHIGDPILFVRVGVGLPFEIQILLRNLQFFGRLMVSGKDIRGYEKATLFKFVTEYMDDPSIDITVFCMHPKTQLKLLRGLMYKTAEDLYTTREPATALFGLDGKLVQKNYDALGEGITNILSRIKKFHDPEFWMESFVKSLGMRYITSKLPSMSKIFANPEKIDPLLVVQIDGGYPFAFWWKGLESMPDTKFVKGNYFVNGIAHGDEYYPAVSTAGVIAQILSFNLEKLHLYPVDSIDPPIEKDDFSSFYQNHSRAVTLRAFQNRVMFIGHIAEETSKYIPYLLHRRDRRKTYEPFYLNTDFRWFFRVFGKGTPENNLVVAGKSLSSRDKDNLKFFNENNYEVLYVSDLADDFDGLVNELDSEIQITPMQKRTSLSPKLKKIEEFCKDEFHK